MAQPKYDSIIDIGKLALFKDRQDAGNAEKFARKGVDSLSDLDARAAAKLDGVEEGAQANVVEAVTAGDVPVAPEGKAVALGSAALAEVEYALTDGTALPTGGAVAEYVEGLGYQTASDVAAAIAAAVATAVDYRGSVAAFADLPEGARAGDMYNVAEDDMNYVWNGSSWDKMAPLFDATGLVYETEFTVATNEQIDALFATPEGAGEEDPQ